MRTETQVFPLFARPDRLLLVALVLAAAVTLVACDSANGDNAKEGKEEVPAVPVEVATTQRAEMAALYTGTAPVESDRKAFVMPKVQGEIRQVLADEGQRVRAGQLLARLDGDKLRLEVALNEATMNKLDRDYKRNLELQQKGLVSAAALDNLKYELEAAKANWELARLQLSYCDIRSPIGRHGGPAVFDVMQVRQHRDTRRRRHREHGQLDVRRRGPRHADVARRRAGQRELAKLVVGQPAQLTFDAVPGHVFLGTISLISPYVNAATGSSGPAPMLPCTPTAP